MRIWKLFLLAALTMWWCSNDAATALDRENLRFYLPFERDLQPRIAGADTQMQFVKGSAGDAKLVEGRRGRGLKVTPEFKIVYQTRKSFSPREGTMALWMKPVGWSGVGHLRHFLGVTTDAYSMSLYVYYGNPWFYVGGGGRYDLIGGSNWQFAFAKEAFPDGEWTFLAATYKPGQQAFYINGKLVISRTDGLIEPEFGNKGNVEIHSGDQVVDEIMIFDRVLTEHEIRSVYQANAPD
jgi:hypothetical protein